MNTWILSYRVTGTYWQLQEVHSLFSVLYDDGSRPCLQRGDIALRSPVQPRVSGGRLHPVLRR